jgi:hypothetical protein
MRGEAVSEARPSGRASPASTNLGEIDYVEFQDRMTVIRVINLFRDTDVIS